MTQIITDENNKPTPAMNGQKVSKIQQLDAISQPIR